MKAHILELTNQVTGTSDVSRVILPADVTFKRLHDTILLVFNQSLEETFVMETTEVIITNDAEISKAAKSKNYTGKTVKSPSRIKMDTYLEQGEEIQYRSEALNLEARFIESVEDYYFGFPTLLKAPESIDFSHVNEMLKHIKYQKTQWDLIDHENYFVKQDKYRGVSMPVEKKAKQEVKTINEELVAYAIAAGNLYGFIGMPAFVKLYNDQHEQKIEAMDVLFLNETAAQTKIADQQVTIYKDAIVHKDLEEIENIVEFQKVTFGKAYYAPAREEFLKYRDSSYYEMTNDIQFVITKMANELCAGSELVAEQHIRRFIGKIRKDVKVFNAAIGELFGALPFKNEQQVHEFMGLFVIITNNTRFWTNRGHKAAELSTRRPEPVAEKVVQPVAEVKVGRNDPCPCGSGKKFKKCCGK